jgi:hypothetical protein
VSDRWSLGGKKGKVKARQRSADLDLLMAHAGAINEKFQDLVSFQERMSETGFNTLINVQADYVRSHIHTYIQTYLSIHPSIYLFIYLSIYLKTYIYVFHVAYIYMYIYMHVYIYINIYIFYIYVRSPMYRLLPLSERVFHVSLNRC